MSALKEDKPVDFFERGNSPVASFLYFLHKALLFRYAISFQHAEEFLAEAIRSLALAKEPIEVADFQMPQKPVYLPPDDGLKFCPDPLEIYPIHEVLDKFLPFTGCFEGSFTRQFFEIVLGNIHVISITQNQLVESSS